MASSIGRVFKLKANRYEVHSKEGIFNCTLRGRFKKDKLPTTRLAAVGDEVEFTKTSSNEGVIEKILPRTSKISRHDVINPKKEQVIAANINNIVTIQSVDNPPLNLHLLDRSIVMSLEAGIEPVICINKVDLKPRLDLKKALSPYKYKLVFTSALKKTGIDELKDILNSKISVFIGPSGVGKSSLLNCLNPQLNLKVKAVSKKSGEGTHTTSWIELVNVGNAFVADTPGLEFFTLWNINEDNLSSFFEEFSDYSCRFSNCRHENEPDCGVKKAVASDKIEQSRYKSYIEILKKIRSRH